MKKELKDKAIKLRRRGKSYREIGEDLGIAKSTASLWCRNEKMSAEGKVRFHNLIEFSKLKAQKVLLDKNEKYLKELDKNCLVLKNSSRFSRDELKIFLALLYWGEGAKTHKKFAFINSDPEMMRVYLNLLRSAFDIDENKFSAWLHLHDYHNRKEMIKFWSKVTGIDKKKINIYNKKHSGIRKKHDYKGCINVRYSDYRLFDEVMLIIQRFVKKF